MATAYCAVSCLTILTDRVGRLGKHELRGPSLHGFSAVPWPSFSPHGLCERLHPTARFRHHANGRVPVARSTHRHSLDTSKFCLCGVFHRRGYGLETTGQTRLAKPRQTA